MLTFDRDPEEIGPEHPDDLELRMDTQSSIHTFNPDENGICKEYLIRHGMRGVKCNSSNKWSVFHDNSDEPSSRFMEGGNHYHDGGDCMCFEYLDDPYYN